MDKNEFKKFVRELDADPDKPVSHGTVALMRLMGMPPPPPRPAKDADKKGGGGA